MEIAGRCVAAILLIGAVGGHNWMNTPGRARKVSFVKPCPARQNLQQAHLQINPGKTFPVEWAMGHEGTMGNWVLVRAEDEMKLKMWDDKVASKYFAAAPKTETFKSYFVDGKSVDNINRKKAKNGCGVKAGTRVFSGQSDVKNPQFARPSHFEPFAPAGYKFYEYNPDMDDNCKGTTWAGYENKDYPWIVAASGYTVATGAAKSGSMSLFKVPAAAASGKYVLHWWWRKYVNCLDINVVVGSKVTDIWGSPQAGPTRTGDGKHASSTKQELVTSRIDHCQTHRSGYLASNPDNPEIDFSGFGGNVKDQHKFTDAERIQRFKTGKRLEAENLARQKENLDKQNEFEAARKKRKADVKKTKKNYKKDAQYKALSNELSDLKKKFNRITGDMFRQVVIPFLGKLNRQDWGVWYPKCQIIRKGEDAAAKCANLCKPSTGNRDSDAGEKCDSVNIVPWKHPATSIFAGEVNMMIPDWCVDDYKDMDDLDDARICYQLKEPPPTDGGPGMTITSDPNDPAWYSTCLKTLPSSMRTFTGPTCGDPCLLKDDSLQKGSQWRFGDRCISCSQMKTNTEDTSAKFVPEWSLAPANSCMKCGNDADTDGTQLAQELGADGWAE